MPLSAPPELLGYYAAGKPLACEIEASPYLCEFWPLDELGAYNADYEVSEYAPGYFGFGSNGGGEMFAISPTGAVVYMPFIGMGPEDALELAPNWSAFERQLKNAL